MPKIKVTGFMHTDDLDVDHVDLNNEMGLSNDGFMFYNDNLELLEEITFELIRD